MDDELSFEKMDLLYAGKKIGVVSRRAGSIYMLSLPLVRLSADCLRHIADKLDELNGKDSTDAGH